MIRRIAAGETRPLRQRVLRPNQPFEDTGYAGDDDPSTVHVGAFAGDRLVGVASIYREQRAGTDAAAGGGWRLRGMATAPEARGRGHARAMLAACIDYVGACGGGELWCNARTPATGFYRVAGFEEVGDEFDIDGIGPHVVMRLSVASAG